MGGARRGWPAGVRYGVIGAAGVVVLVLLFWLAAVLRGQGAGAPHRTPPSALMGTSSSGNAVDSAPAMAPPGVNAPNSSAESSGALPTLTPAQPPSAPVDVERSLVKTAQVSVEVKDVEPVSHQIRATATGLGGFVSEERTGTDDSTLVLRVPADSLDRLVDAIAPLGRITSRYAQVVDATDQVVDLDARVASQKASVDRVRALLSEAKSIGDVVNIESQLTQRQSDLDSLTRRLASLRDKVALSSLTVDIRSAGAAPVPVAEGGGFLAGLANGWEGLRSLGVGVGGVVGFVLPFLPVLALLLGLYWLVRRTVARTRRAPAIAGARSGPGSEGES